METRVIANTSTLAGIASTVNTVLYSARPVEYKFKFLNTSTTETIWTPSAGKSIKLISFIVSSSGISDVALIFGTSTLCYMFFGEKRAVPLSIPFILDGGTDVALKAWTSSGTVAITLIGYVDT